jgi:hypothetical protein
MNINEKKIVFNYLKEKHSQGKNKKNAEQLAYIEYDEMPENQREFILRNIIISYLVDIYSQSLTFNWVNGSPEKRRYRIMEYSLYKYDKLNAAEYELIIENILDN